MKKIIEKYDDINKGTIVLRCDDRCCSLVIDKYIDDTPSYSISIQDSYYKSNGGVVNRINRAFKALFGRPIYYNDLYISEEDTMKEFIEELHKLFDEQ